jgi:hypothetical protein
MWHSLKPHHPQIYNKIQCASINCRVGIAFPSTIYSVDLSHNVGIALCSHIQCASLNYHVGIAFRAPTSNVD